MNDGIIRGDGNSRFLKSNVSSALNLSQILGMLNAGTFPIDLNGINASGWVQQGTPLNKATLLSDASAAAVATAAGAASPPQTVSAALEALGVLCSGKIPQITAGTYTGTGLYGITNPNALTFDFFPKVLFIVTDGYFSTYKSDTSKFLLWSGGTPAADDKVYGALKFTKNGKVLSWYSGYTGGSSADVNAYLQFNAADVEYFYIALGTMIE